MSKMARFPGFTVLLIYTVFYTLAKDIPFGNLRLNPYLDNKNVLTTTVPDQFQRMAKMSRDLSAFFSKRENCDSQLSRCVVNSKVGTPMIDILDFLHIMSNKTSRDPNASIIKENKPLRTQVWKNLLKPHV